MTCYIPPIDHPEAVYTILIQRFDPARDKQPYWATYRVPFVATMTVIEALEYLWDQGEYIAFRANCREFTCGSCAMLIDGDPRLACDTLLKDNMRLEPLQRYPLVKDLIVDTRAVEDRLKALSYWPLGGSNEERFLISEQTLERFNRVYSRCIECYCCLEACPASSAEDAPFDGPMYMLQLARAHYHPLDGMNRAKQSLNGNITSCVSCFECARICPVHLSPAEEIAELRRNGIKGRVLGLLRRGRE